MNDLLKFTIDAHGGLVHWRKFKQVSAHLNIGGITWALKQVPGIMDEINVSSSTIEQHVSYSPFIKAGWHNIFGPNKVAILDRQGTLIDQLHFPRNSFKGYATETPWSKLQLTYFTGYAMWTYLNAPFCFAWPGYEVKEIAPWTEDGQSYRRLQVTFPDDIATHSREQVFYIDETGLLKRHDYNVEVLANAESAHYLSDYAEVQGIKFPTNRNVYKRNDDNTALAPNPLFISIRLSDIKLS